MGSPKLIGPFTGDSYWVVGGKYTFKVLGAENDGAMMMLEAEIPSAPGPPPHIHEREDEIFYVLHGEITVLSEGKVSKAGAGTTVFLPRNRKHTFWNESGSMAKLLILASPAGIEDFFVEIGQPVGAGDVEAPPVTPEMIAHLYEVSPRYGITLDPPPAG